MMMAPPMPSRPATKAPPMPMANSVSASAAVTSARPERRVAVIVSFGPRRRLPGKVVREERGGEPRQLAPHGHDLVDDEVSIEERPQRTEREVVQVGRIAVEGAPHE